MPSKKPVSRPRYPAAVADILRAQDEGARSYSSGEKCPYGKEDARSSFLREQWARGRALARVERMKELGLYGEGEQ